MGASKDTRESGLAGETGGVIYISHWDWIVVQSVPGFSAGTLGTPRLWERPEAADLIVSRADREAIIRFGRRNPLPGAQERIAKTRKWEAARARIIAMVHDGLVKVAETHEERRLATPLHKLVKHLEK